jgi:hypothetical protein
MSEGDNRSRKPGSMLFQTGRDGRLCLLDQRQGQLR